MKLKSFSRLHLISALGILIAFTSGASAAEVPNLLCKTNEGAYTLNFVSDGNSSVSSLKLHNVGVGWDLPFTCQEVKPDMSLPQPLPGFSAELFCTAAPAWSVILWKKGTAIFTAEVYVKKAPVAAIASCQPAK